MFKKFDAWVQSGPFTSLDLAIYRIVYSCSVICIVPSIQWLSEYPGSIIRAPLGPLQLVSEFPSPVVLMTLELLRTLALVLLAVGVFTRVMSIAVSALLFVTFGLTYTLGKIDHTLLIVVVPLVLSFSRWGDRLSVDALIRASDPKPTPQWPLRFLAFVIGLSFFEAAGIKLSTGWLELSSHAVQGHFFDHVVAGGRDSWLNQLAVHVNIPVAWEALDWLTVILEFAILLAVPWWRAFRVTLAFATFFHLGVLFLFNIGFTHNLIAYAAFVSWAVVACRIKEKFALRFSRAEHRQPRVIGRGALATVFVASLAFSIAIWLLRTNSGVLTYCVKFVFLFGSPVFSAFYLIGQIRTKARNSSSADREESQTPQIPPPR